MAVASSSPWPRRPGTWTRDWDRVVRLRSELDPSADFCARWSNHFHSTSDRGNGSSSPARPTSKQSCVECRMDLSLTRVSAPTSQRHCFPRTACMQHAPTGDKRRRCNDGSTRRSPSGATSACSRVARDVGSSFPRCQQGTQFQQPAARVSTEAHPKAKPLPIDRRSDFSRVHATAVVRLCVVDASRNAVLGGERLIALIFQNAA